MYFLLGLILLVGGGRAMLESIRERSEVLAMLSLFVCALGAMICVAVVAL